MQSSLRTCTHQTRQTRVPTLFWHHLSHAWVPHAPVASVLQAWYTTRLLWQTAFLPSALIVVGLLVLDIVWALAL
jgi:hypothetical protein